MSCSRRWILLVLFCLKMAGLSASAELTIPLDEKLAKLSLDRALICLATYDRDGAAEVVGWKGPFYQFGDYYLSDGQSGLHAGVYERTGQGMAREAVLAFRGTEPDQINDWLTDFSNFAGLVPEAYMEGAKSAQIVRIMTRKNGVESLSLTGHSLGGGIASYSALMLRLRATCFGSAALGEGLQRVLWQEASPQTGFSENLVMHIFKQDDIVPILTASTGRHFGVIAVPSLRSPPDYTGIRTPEEKLAYLLVSGMISEKWLKSAGKVAMTHIMEGHGIDQYIAGLTYLISPPGQFSPAGEWTSKGSFFDITSNESRFRFCRNGRFTVINDFKFMELVRQQTNDSGEWHFQHPSLHMRIPGVARMTYVLQKGDGVQSVVWRRSAMKSDPPELDSLKSKAEKDSAVLTAGIMGAILKNMEGKTVNWSKSQPRLYPDNTTPPP